MRSVKLKLHWFGCCVPLRTFLLLSALFGQGRDEVYEVFFSFFNLDVYKVCFPVMCRWGKAAVWIPFCGSARSCLKWWSAASDDAQSDTLCMWSLLLISALGWRFDSTLAAQHTLTLWPNCCIMGDVGTRKIICCPTWVRLYLILLDNSLLVPVNLNLWLWIVFLLFNLKRLKYVEKLPEQVRPWAICSETTVRGCSVEKKITDICLTNKLWKIRQGHWQSTVFSDIKWV